MSTEILEQTTVHSASNIDFDAWFQISDINDFGNINSDPSRPIMKVDIMYYRFTLLSILYLSYLHARTSYKLTATYLTLTIKHYP